MMREISDKVVQALECSKKGQLKYDTGGPIEIFVNEVKDSENALKFHHSNHSSSSLFEHSPSVSRVIDSSTNNEKSLTNGCGQPDENDGSSSSKSAESYITVTSAASTVIDDKVFKELEAIKQYESSREEIVRRRTEEFTDRVQRSYRSQLEATESEMSLIYKKFLLLRLQEQKQYEEEYTMLVRSIEDDLQRLNQNTSSLTDQSHKSSSVGGHVKLRMKEFEERTKMALRNSELKRQQQTQYRQSLVANRDAISELVSQCDQAQEKFKCQQFDNSLRDELNHLRTQLLGLTQDLELLLLQSVNDSNKEFTPEQLSAGAAKQAEAIRIKEKFFSTLSQHATTNNNSVSHGRHFTEQQSQAQTNSANQSQPKTSIPSMVTSTATNTLTNQQSEESETDKLSDELSMSAQKLYISSQLELISFEEECVKFGNNPANKTHRSQLQICVRSILNTMCHESVEKLRKQLQKLLHLFCGKPVEDKGKKVQCTDANGSRQFVINDTAKYFLNVAVKQKNMPLKLAPVIVILWSAVPLFGRIFLGHLYRSCPYAVPYYPTKESADQSDVEYMVTCGYHINSEGQISETDEIFQERMYTMIQLYSAVCQCNMPPEDHPRDMQYSWNWLARVLSQPPKCRLTALMLDAFLSVSAHKLIRVYGRQFRKMMHYITNNYVHQIEQFTEKSERQTLMKFKTLLGEIERKLKLRNEADAAKELANKLDLVPDYFFVKSYIYMATN